MPSMLRFLLVALAALLATNDAAAQGVCFSGVETEARRVATREFQSYNAPGSWTSLGTSVYTYDAALRLSVIRDDDGDPTTTDRTTTYAYDGLDRVASETTDDHDHRDDRVALFRYDAEGTTREARYDHGTEAPTWESMTQRSLTTAGSDCQRESAQHDERDGGAWVTVGRDAYTYADGLLVELIVYGRTTPPDPDVPNTRYRYQNEDGGVVGHVQESWNAMAGVFEPEGTATYSYDAHGDLVTLVRHRTDGTPRSRVLYTYEANPVSAETEVPRTSARLSLASANPSRGGASLWLSGNGSSPARLDLVASDGRLVARLHDSAVPAGRVRIALPLGLAPGVYTARLVADGLVETLRLTIAG